MDNEHQLHRRWRRPSGTTLIRLLYASAAFVTALASMIGALNGCSAMPSAS